MWGLSTDQVWVAAELPGGPLPHGGGLLFHNDGTLPGQEVYNDPSQGVWSVWGDSPENLWVTGDFGSIIHYDGTEWSTVWASYINSSSLLESLWGGAGDDVYVAGSNGTILHYTR